MTKEQFDRFINDLIDLKIKCDSNLLDYPKLKLNQETYKYLERQCEEHWGSLGLIHDWSDRMSHIVGFEIEIQEAS